MASVFTLTVIQVIVAVLLFVALLNGQRDLTVLSLLVLGVLGGARLWARFSQARLQCHLKIDRRRVFPNEPVTLTISAENAKLLPIWLHVEVPIGTLAHSSDEQTLTKETSLLWYQRTQFRWELLAAKRGVHQLGPLDVLTGDLFSFFTKRQRTNEAHSLVVYPRLVALKPFTLPRRDFFGVPKATSPVQDPIFILGTRDYQHGQPSKYIHWKASARRHRLQEKVFESTVQEKVLLVVNVDSFVRNEAEDDFERALEIVASMAARFDRQGHSVGLITDGALHGNGRSIISVARNDQQLAAILEVLARLEMKPARNIDNLLRRAIADTWGISCVYFSFETNDHLVATSKYFERRHVPVMFCVSRQSARAEVPRRVYRADELCAEASR